MKRWTTARSALRLAPAVVDCGDDSSPAITPNAPAGIDDDEGIRRLQFTGTGTTESGSRGQRLASTFFVEGQPARSDAP